MYTRLTQKYQLQEEERERKDNYVPEVSAIDTETIEIDQDTKQMLRKMDMHNLQGNIAHWIANLIFIARLGLQVVNVQQSSAQDRRRRQ
jgi:membrane associated rhomboid family serine protease